MDGARQTGIIFSTLLHLLVLAFAIWGLPELFARKKLQEPSAITVELVPIGAISNIKPSAAPKKEKVQAAPKEAKPTPPVRTAEPKPVATPPAPTPEKKKEPKPVVKKEEKKEKPKKKEREQDLSAVLAAVKKTAQQDQNKNDKEDSDTSPKSRSSSYDPTKPLSLSQKDFIVSQFIQCWTPPIGAKDAHELIIVVDVELEQGGLVRSVKLNRTSQARASNDSFYRAAALSAIRAVKKCSPLKNLPTEQYSRWKEMELTFDPKDMLY